MLGDNYSSPMLEISMERSGAPGHPRDLLSDFFSLPWFVRACPVNTGVGSNWVPPKNMITYVVFFWLMSGLKELHWWFSLVEKSPLCSRPVAMEICWVWEGQRRESQCWVTHYYIYIYKELNIYPQNRVCNSPTCRS